ncbi:helix-turn-helix transcriptional regulator [Paraburkholderia caribensis]|uniref:helix-turn-helix transcriptional regulator n=1 Tax=Paraburkholderia caribensis TaxID=75105 RepID=UPI001CAE5A60|nr:AlpA family phage regulatory protein [Paraburkholderia caribensis]CAG9250025.1 hypothetical protein PCAR4_260105 [Paraburkholderia caribensis]
MSNTPDSTNPNALPQSGMLRLSQFSPQIIPLSSVTIWRMLNDGRFPEPLRVSTRLRLWHVEDLHEWMRVGPDEWQRLHPVVTQGEQQ